MPVCRDKFFNFARMLSPTFFTTDPALGDLRLDYPERRSEVQRGVGQRPGEGAAERRQVFVSGLICPSTPNARAISWKRSKEKAGS